VTIGRYSDVGRDRHQGPLRGTTVRTIAYVSQPASNRMAVVVGTGSPDLKVGGRGEFETVYGRGEGVVKCRF
jgi:hypothetical protein